MFSEMEFDVGSFLIGSFVGGICGTFLTVGTLGLYFCWRRKNEDKSQTVYTTEDNPEYIDTGDNEEDNYTKDRNCYY